MKDPGDLALNRTMERCTDYYWENQSTGAENVAYKCRISDSETRLDENSDK